MIVLKQLNNIFDIKDEQERLLAKNVKSLIYVKPSDVVLIQEVYNTNTKKSYKKRCLIRVREAGDFIILNSPEEMLNKLTESNKIGYGRRK